MKKYILHVSLVAMLSGYSSLFAQNKAQEASLQISRTDGTITLDGILDEAAWQEADKATGFYKTFPVDNEAADEQTIVRLTYDDKNLYVGAICYTSHKGEYLIESLRRDFRFWRNDVFAVYIDPYNDKSNGFSFQVTPMNVQREGLVTLGGDVADNWDNKWFSEVTRYEDRYVVEMAIPFKSFRYNSSNAWNINFLRNHPKINQRSTWIQVPIQYRSSDLVYTGKLNWDIPPKPTNRNVAVIPYVTANTFKDFENDEPVDNSANAGLDAKIGLTPSLNLDVTINPDFSQVEVDQQVNNLGRFEISFPERRQFFLENQDLFAQNGFPSARPFFSRRIGIIGSGSSAKQIPILAGGRLSGKLGRDWRVGLLNMQTGNDVIEDDGEIETFPGQNYTVGILQRQILQRSNISAIVVNRTTTNFDSSDSTITSDKYNRVVGFDYNLATLNNQWEGNLFFHKSISPESTNKAYASGAFLSHQTRNFRIGYFQLLVGDNYQADVGFVPRTGINRFGTFTNYTFYPEGNNTLISHGPEFNYTIVTESDLDILDREVRAEYNFRFQNTGRAGLAYNWNYVTLTSSFAPNGIEGDTLTDGSIHRFGSFRIDYNTDGRKLFNMGSTFSTGKFYTGNRTRLNLRLNYRIQPIFVSSLRIDYNRLTFDEFTDVEYLLVGTRFDLTLTNKLFLTSFFQYNDRADNFNINARLQWRFKPVSDIFLVYTENYGGDLETVDVVPRFNNGFIKNRAIVLKVTYWLNL